MEKEPSITPTFSMEHKSKGNITDMMMTNGGSPVKDLSEGVLRELVRAYFAEGIFWELFITSGVLIVGLRVNETIKRKLKDEAEAK